MESLIQCLRFFLDKYREEQMAKGVKIKRMIKKKDVESKLHRAEG